MASKKYSLLTGVLCLLASVGFSQVTYDVMDSSVVGSKDMDQYTKFKQGIENYPAKPRNQWELGIKTGIFTVSGDVSSQVFTVPNIGLHVRKAFGYVFSARLEYVHGTAKGMAWLPSHDEETARRMKAFGEKVGIAFQIKDDLFDYASQDVGKPTGNDIKEKKLTLPLIYTLNNVDKETRRKMIYIIKNENTRKAKVRYIIDVVENNGGIEYTNHKMIGYKKEALDLLYSFPDSPVRDGFADLVNFVTDRKY